MRSTVNWALLGLVISRPGYGYELVQRFERAYEESIHLSSPSQIYVALDALEGRGLVEKRLPPQQGAAGRSTKRIRQPKPRYHATEEGAGAYEEWLVAQVEQERSRSRLFATQVALLPADHALAVLERYEAACLEVASATPGVLGGQARARTASTVAERLTFEDDRLALEARLAWIQYARLQFASGVASSDRPS
jgi:DNA-binding PadR family transcriptional regulator